MRVPDRVPAWSNLDVPYPPGLLKDNIMLLVKHHKEHCDGSCGVSLLLVKALLRQAGHKLTEEDERYLI